MRKTRILIVTPNPTLDRILTVPRVQAGTVHRTTSSQVFAGGKGMNVYRAMQQLQGTYPLVEFMHTGILSGDSGKLFEKLAERQGVTNCKWFWLPNCLQKQDTRTCILVYADDEQQNTVTAPDTTVFNEEGPTLSQDDWKHFADHVVSCAKDTDMIMFCGSVPLGVQPVHFAQLVHQLAQEKIVLVDTSKAPLRALLQDYPENVIIKVNASEIMDALQIPSCEQIIAIAKEKLIARGTYAIIVTLGKHGAYMFTASGKVFKIGAPHMDHPFVVKSTVGCGDVFHAAYAMSCAQAIAENYQQLQPQEKLIFNNHAYNQVFEQVEHVMKGVTCASASTLTKLPAQFDLSVVEQFTATVEQVE